MAILQSYLFTDIDTVFTHLGKDVHISYTSERPNDIRVYMLNPYLPGHTVNITATAPDLITMAGEEEITTEEQLEQCLIEFILTQRPALDSFVERSEEMFLDIARRAAEEEAALAAGIPVVDENATPAPI